MLLHLSRRNGRSGLRVSDLCLGAMTFGEDWGWGAAKNEARKIYDAYREAGGNFIDTANIYTNGSSEKLVGEFVAGHREEVIVATKYTNATSVFAGKPGTDANAGGNQRKNMVQAVEASLKRLGTDYIDLYWRHIWDQITPAEEVMRAFDDLVGPAKFFTWASRTLPPGWCLNPIPRQSFAAGRAMSASRSSTDSQGFNPGKLQFSGTPSQGVTS